MLQTFDDLCVEKENSQDSRLFFFLLRVFTDTVFSILKEYSILITETMKNKPLALVGYILIAPFSLFIAIGIVWQILHLFGYASSPYLASLIPDRLVGYTMIFIFPALALILNLVVLIISAFKSGFKNSFRLKFMKANFLTVSIVVLSSAIFLFIFGHDSIPCFAHGILKDGLNHIWLNVKGCLNA